MLVWIWLSLGVALAAVAVALVLGMKRAERRARRALFRQLGLSEEVIELLMAHDGDVLADLALVRRHGLDGDAPIEPETLPMRLQPTIRLVRPTVGAAGGDHIRAAGDRRRLRTPGRHGRP